MLDAIASSRRSAEATAGYLHEGYASALSEFGAVAALPRSGGWMLQRPIPGAAGRDAMGCYPLFACRNWHLLPADLQSLEGSLISFSAVLDPLGDFDEALLGACFPDRVLPFKLHYITDLSRPASAFVSSRHQRNVRKALKAVRVEVSDSPIGWLEDWVKLYRNIIDRFRVGDIRAFSPGSFAKQLQVPGMVAFRAFDGETVTGMILCYRQGETACYHLGAYSPRGYEVKASFALFWTALEYFTAKGVRLLNLGGGAGMVNSIEDGLSQFKSGWATETRTAYFCGRILDHDAYNSLTRSRGKTGTDYFPAYRQGEFCKQQPADTTPGKPSDLA